MDLYEQDTLAWSELQAGLLARLAAGERVNASVDWANVIEEVLDVGMSQLRACRSLLRKALEHMLKLHAWPESRDVPHWGGELLGVLSDARDRYAPSMRNRIELAELYGRALHDVSSLGVPGMQPLPRDLSLTLEELMAPRPDLRYLMAKFGDKA